MSGEPRPADISPIPSNTPVFNRVLELTRGKPSVELRNKLYQQISDNRQQVLENTIARNPFVVKGTLAQGDNFLTVSALQFAVSHLCRENNINPPEMDFNIQYLTKNAEPKKGFKVSPLIRKVNELLTQVPGVPRRENFYNLLRTNYAIGLGLTLTPDDLQHVAQPFKTDSGAMAQYNQEKVIANGSALRGEILKTHDQIIVINQGGSAAEKRFNDSQVVDLAEAMRKRFPKAYIVVVSDKVHAVARLKKWQTLPRDEQESEDLPFNDVIFVHEIQQQKRSKMHEADHAIDEVIITEDINTPCTFFYAADRIITTDNFYMHLGAGTMSLRPEKDGRLSPGDVLSLFTVNVPESWNVPGGEYVISKYLTQPKHTSTLPEDYEAYFHGKNARGTHKIADVDMRNMKRAIAQLPDR